MIKSIVDEIIKHWTDPDENSLSDLSLITQYTLQIP